MHCFVIMCSEHVKVGVGLCTAGLEIDQLFLIVYIFIGLPICEYSDRQLKPTHVKGNRLRYLQQPYFATFGRDNSGVLGGAKGRQCF